MSTTFPDTASRETVDSTRLAVRSLLSQSPAFAQLAPEQQKQMAHDLVQVGAFLAEPGMRLAPQHMAPAVKELGVVPADALAQAPDASQWSSTSDGGVNESDSPKFGAAVRTGVEQAVALISGVNFPGFVSGLINGVFHSIVRSSIEQMEAYAKLVADVSKSLNQFRDENTTANQGRDHLVDQFPDIFQLQEPGQGDPFSFGDGAAAGPRVVMREDVDEKQAVARLNNSGLPLAQPLTHLDDELVESTLVPAARTTIATGRQQLLATMVMMGINRIVVTDGKIMAKVMFDFQSRDNRRFAKSATKYDYAHDKDGNVQSTTAISGTYEGNSKDRSVNQSWGKDGGSYQEDGASSYAKGDYNITQTPIVTLQSTSALRDDSSLQTKASLAGHVEVNFKSDYLPLEKMADPAAIAAIQMNAQPGMVKTMAGRPAPKAGAAAPAAAPAPAAATPAPAPAA
jgi:hypothetical protein